MQTFLKTIGFITIFIGIILGIYLIAISLNDYAAVRASNNYYLEQLNIIKMIAGGAIIVSSVVSGILYLSFGIIIELLEAINHKLTPVEPKKEEEEVF